MPNEDFILVAGQDFNILYIIQGDMPAVVPKIIQDVIDDCYRIFLGVDLGRHRGWIGVSAFRSNFLRAVKYLRNSKFRLI